jgi:multiple sugar transport system permease protein
MMIPSAVAGSKNSSQPLPIGPRKPRLVPASGYAFSSLYALLLVAFGVLPTLYALYLSFTGSDGSFVGGSNYARVVVDFRFWPAVGHVASYLVIWLVALLFFVVVLSLLVHAIRSRFLSGTFRFVFYLPGALAGASSVLLWLFVLNPTVSPVGGLLQLFGFTSMVSVLDPSNLPVVFAIIAFWTGAGGWIIVMFGALNNIPQEVMEAARIDGAGSVQVALQIQLPMMRKWISYMGIMSVNQLTYLYAFQQNDFHGSAAISIILLLISLALSALFVARGGLFETE